MFRPPPPWANCGFAGPRCRKWPERMHIVVIGAGIIGMTTAYALRRDGHKVSVLDARCGPGHLTSKANGAQLSYSYVAPLAEPAVLPRLLSWLVRKDSPLRLRLRADPAQWRWGLRFLWGFTRTCSQKSTGELLALGTRSRERMHLLVAQERLAFHFASSGKLLIYQDPQAYRAALVQLAYLATLGCQQHALDRAACLKQEPVPAGIGGRVERAAPAASSRPPRRSAIALRCAANCSACCLPRPCRCSSISAPRRTGCGSKRTGSLRWRHRRARWTPTHTSSRTGSAPRRWPAGSASIRSSIRSRAIA